MRVINTRDLLIAIICIIGIQPLSASPIFNNWANKQPKRNNIENKINKLKSSGNSLNKLDLAQVDFINISNSNSNWKESEFKVIQIKDINSILERNNPQLKANKAKIMQAKYILNSEISAWYPTLDLSANGLPQYLNGKTYINNSSDLSSEKWSSSITSTIKWNLIDPARTPGIESARKKFEREKYKYLISIRDLRLESIIAFHKLQKANTELEIAKNSLNLSRLNLENAKSRLKGGLGTKFELLEAETELSRSEQLLARSIGNQKINQLSLGKILHLQPHIIPIVKAPHKIAGIWNKTLEESLNAAYDFRKELESASIDIAINNYNAKAAKAATYPIISVVNSLTNSFSKGQSNVASPNMNTDSSTLSNTIGLNATWSIFDGGRSKALYDYNKSQAKESEYNLSLVKYKIKNEVEENFLELQILYKNIRSSYLEVLSTTEALRLSRMRFNAGIATQYEVINKQKDHTDAEVKYNNIIADYNIKLAQMQRGTGINDIKACISLEIQANEEKMKDNIESKSYSLATPCQD